jgi:MoxR-like ATPase
VIFESCDICSIDIITQKQTSLKPFDRAVRGAQTIFSSVASRLPKREEQVKIALACVLSSGHLLIEGPSGLGKTRLAETIATALGLPFSRVQMTADLMPSDITGFSVYHPPSHDFVFFEGPLFASIVLVDEINRAMPRTQSAMLEAMEERRVTVEGVTHPLPDPFMVFATQNPADQSGTFPLPESQLDRFLLCTGIGYPPEDLEKGIISGGGIRERIGGISPVATGADILAARRAVAEEIYLSDKVVGYIYALVSATRSHPRILTGLSTRAAINLAQASRAAAFLEGRDYVAPEDVKGVAAAVCSHRLLMRPEHEAVHRGELLRTIIADIPLPLA